MKKLFLLCVTILVSFWAVAQDNDIKSGVMKKAGTIWLIKPMADTVKLANGLMLRSDGTIQKKSGKTVSLNNGDCMTKHGDLVPLSDKSIKVAYIRNGSKMWEATRVTKSVLLNDGTKITPNGNVKKGTDKAVMLKEDQIMDLSSSSQ